MIDHIESFVERLSKFNVAQGETFNQYALETPRHNLGQYLRDRLADGAQTLFLGEAAGYLGCRLSGIPFTSGHVIANHDLYDGARARYLYPEIESVKENSAKIIHDYFQQHPTAFRKIVFWNAFPFHPHQSGNPASNRKPTAAERKAGIALVTNLFDIFHFTAYYPIGRCAEETLERMQAWGYCPRFKFTTIRHPSYGGKPQFVKDVDSILQALNLEGGI